MRARWAQALRDRKMNTEGYIHTQQHDGPAHAEGWPFPRWMEARGIGWHFRGTASRDTTRRPRQRRMDDYRRQAWRVNEKGWVIDLNDPGARYSPALKINAKDSPWLRLTGGRPGIDGANCYVNGPHRTSRNSINHAAHISRPRRRQGRSGRSPNGAAEWPPSLLPRL